MTMRLAGVLIGPAILAFLIVTGLSYVVPEPSSDSQARAMGLVWGGRIFTSQGEFARWLAERGRSYQEWNRLHPGSPWATTPSKQPASATDRRVLTSNAEPGSNSMLVAVLGGTLVLVTGLLAIGLALVVRMKRTVDRLTEPSVLFPRPPPLPSTNGATALVETRPRRESAGVAARRAVEAARPRLESAGVAARRAVEAAGPRLESAGVAARRGVGTAATETAELSLWVRYSTDTGGLRTAMFYGLVAVSGAAMGLAIAILL